jgi:hypothetical protein
MLPTSPTNGESATPTGVPLNNDYMTIAHKQAARDKLKA